MSSKELAFIELNQNVFYFFSKLIKIIKNKNFLYVFYNLDFIFELKLIFSKSHYG